MDDRIRFPGVEVHVPLPPASDPPASEPQGSQDVREFLAHVIDEARRLERDMAVAAEISRALVPSVLPRCAGYELDAFVQPACDTSGDLFDVVPLPDGSLVVLVADATGHGIGPALSATQLRAMVRIGLRLGAPIDRIVAEADRQLCVDLPPDRFVTAFVGELDPVRHELRYIAPGQGPLLHWHAREGVAEWRNATCPPFGVPYGGNERAAPMPLAPGDIVLVATDGLFERPAPDGALFGTQRVEAVVRATAAEPASQILAAVRAHADAFAGGLPPCDDATLVVLKRTP